MLKATESDKRLLTLNCEQTYADLFTTIDEPKGDYMDLKRSFTLKRITT